MTSSPRVYQGHRFPPELIGRAVWLYHRFSLSLRDAEDPASPTQRRKRQMQGSKSAAQAQWFLVVYGLVQNLFRVGRHLLRAVNHRVFREHAFAEWNELVSV